MSEAHDKGFDYSLGAVEESWDVFADEDIDERGDEDESSPELVPDPEKIAKLPVEPTPAPETPAAERIARLFERLRGRKRVMMGILKFLQEPQNTLDLDVRVVELQVHDFSLYTGTNYAALLEEAGAIMKLNEDGSPFDASFEQIPDIIEINGVEFLKPVKGRRIYWQNTADGQAFLEADKPKERMWKLFEDDAIYNHIYRQILIMASAEDGTTMAAITPVADDDPITVKPRLYAPHFVDMLEQCEAIRWDGKWRITEIGREGLLRLEEEAAEAEAEAAAPAPAPADETAKEA